MRISCLAPRSGRTAWAGLVGCLLVLWMLAPLAQPAAQTLATHNIERVGELIVYSTQTLATSGQTAQPGQGAGSLVTGISMPTDIVMRGAWAWLSALNGFWAVDLTDPTHPKLAGHCPLAGQGGKIALTASGARAWVLTGKTGLTGIDLTDPAHPDALTSFTLPNTSQSRELALKGDFAFIQADGVLKASRLLVYDLSAPANPALLYNSEVLGQLSSLSVGGDLLYAIYTVGSIAQKVVILDISDPARPRLRGEYIGKSPYYPSRPGFYPCSLATGNGTIYLSEASNYLFSICSPDGPTGLQVLSQQYNYNGGPPRVAQDRLEFDRSNELRLLDCHNPAAPREIGTYRDSFNTYYTSAMDGDLIVRMSGYVVPTKNQGLTVDVLRYCPSETIQVLSPAGNEILPVGDPIPVHWKSNPTTAGAVVRVELWKISDQGGSPQKVADLGTYSGPGGEGSQEIKLPLKYWGWFRIRVVNAADPAIYGESLEPFQLTPYNSESIPYPGFVTPSGPCVWAAGTTQKVSCELDPLNSYYTAVSFEFWRGPVKSASLGTGTLINGASSLTWTIPINLPPGPGYRIVMSVLNKTQVVGLFNTGDITIVNDQYSPWNAIRGADWALYE